MAIRTLSAQSAAALDKELMSSGAFSIDQLMEVTALYREDFERVYRVHPPSRGNKILVACGPGNNGGDGLVAARHLHHYGYQPTVFYPKRSSNELYQRLATQLKELDIPFTDNFEGALSGTSHVIDAIFGFSFSGEVRDPFKSVIAALESTSVPVLSVDAPSSWTIDSGPPSEGPGKNFHPATLISLTAPKPLIKWYHGTHFLGGRFLPSKLAQKYDLDLPNYPGIDQVVEMKVERAS